jgi:zinc transport system permease protein
MEIFTYSFMVRALIAGLIVAVIAPLIGNFLVMKRFAMIADTLAHVALAGVAVGLLTGTQPVIATIFLTVLTAIVIQRLSSRGKMPSETVLALFMPGGLAVALVLISLANGFNSNLFSYLFGSISTVSSNEIYLIAGLGLLVLATIFAFYQQLLFTSFDEEGARLKGVKVARINLLLMVLTALTVSLTMRVVGALLVSALMVIPSAAAMRVGRSFKQSFFLSVLFALCAVVFGLLVAFYFNLPAGGAIVLVSLGIFAGASAVGKK